MLVRVFIISCFVALGSSPGFGSFLTINSSDDTGASEPATKKRRIQSQGQNAQIPTTQDPYMENIAHNIQTFVPLWVTLKSRLVGRSWNKSSFRHKLLKLCSEPDTTSTWGKMTFPDLNKERSIALLSTLLKDGKELLNGTSLKQKRNIIRNIRQQIRVLSKERSDINIKLDWIEFHVLHGNLLKPLTETGAIPKGRYRITTSQRRFLDEVLKTGTPSQKMQALFIYIKSDSYYFNLLQKSYKRSAMGRIRPRFRQMTRMEAPTPKGKGKGKGYRKKIQSVCANLFAYETLGEFSLFEPGELNDGYRHQNTLLETHKPLKVLLGLDPQLTDPNEIKQVEVDIDIFLQWSLSLLHPHYNRNHFTKHFYTILTCHEFLDWGHLSWKHRANLNFSITEHLKRLRQEVQDKNDFRDIAALGVILERLAPHYPLSGNLMEDCFGVSQIFLTHFCQSALNTNIPAYIRTHILFQRLGAQATNGPERKQIVEELEKICHNTSQCRNLKIKKNIENGVIFRSTYRQTTYPLPSSPFLVPFCSTQASPFKLGDFQIPTGGPAGIWYRLALNSVKQKELKSAIRHYIKFLENTPEDARVRNTRVEPAITEAFQCLGGWGPGQYEHLMKRPYRYRAPLDNLKAHLFALKSYLKWTKRSTNTESLVLDPPDNLLQRLEELRTDNNTSFTVKIFTRDLLSKLYLYSGKRIDPKQSFNPEQVLLNFREVKKLSKEILTLLFHYTPEKFWSPFVESMYHNALSRLTQEYNYLKWSAWYDTLSSEASQEWLQRPHDKEIEILFWHRWLNKFSQEEQHKKLRWFRAL